MTPLPPSAEVRREGVRRRTAATLRLELLDPAGLVVAAGMLTVAIGTAVVCGWVL